MMKKKNSNYYNSTSYGQKLNKKTSFKENGKILTIIATIIISTLMLTVAFCPTIQETFDQILNKKNSKNNDLGNVNTFFNMTSDDKETFIGAWNADYDQEFYNYSITPVIIDQKWYFFGNNSVKIEMKPYDGELLYEDTTQIENNRMKVVSWLGYKIDEKEKEIIFITEYTETIMDYKILDDGDKIVLNIIEQKLNVDSEDPNEEVIEEEICKNNTKETIEYDESVYYSDMTDNATEKGIKVREETEKSYLYNIEIVLTRIDPEDEEEEEETENEDQGNITIVKDTEGPEWDDYDYGITDQDIEVTPTQNGSFITAEISNLGLCKAHSAWGWHSSNGRSCWGEWDFYYSNTETIDVKLRVGDSDPEPGAEYRIELDGEHLGDVTITADDSWYIVTLKNIEISQGEHTLFLGTYQMDYYPDYHIDYIEIGDTRIEGENYDRMGGNDPNADLKGLGIKPFDIKVQIWDGNPSINNSILLYEGLIGETQNVIDKDHEHASNNFTAQYIPSNGKSIVSYNCDQDLTNHIIYIKIDPDNKLEETNEANNLASILVQ